MSEEGLSIINKSNGRVDLLSCKQFSGRISKETTNRDIGLGKMYSRMMKARILANETNDAMLRLRRNHSFTIPTWYPLNEACSVHCAGSTLKS